MRHLSLLLIAVVLSSSAGCSMWESKWGPLSLVDIPNGVPWKTKKNPKGTPVRMAATWTEAVLNQAGEKSERGFGGKIFFYGRKSEKPIETQGQLVVYAFEEDGRAPTDQCPTRRYVFPPEEFVRHKSDSDLGVAYSFWLPWDESGGYQKNISLIARFEPLKGGEMIVSEQTSHRLPGEIDPKTMLAATQPSAASATTGGVAQVSYQEPLGESQASLDPPAKANLQTTSIALPSSIRRRAASAHSSTGAGNTTSVSLLSPGQSIRPMSQQQ